MSGSELGEADIAKSDEGKSETPKKEGTGTRLAIFTRTVIATVILAAAGGAGAGLSHFLIPASPSSTVPPASSGKVATTTTPAPATSGAPPASGEISVMLGSQQSFIAIPDSGDSPNLATINCAVPSTPNFACYELDAEAAEDHHNNQQWKLSATPLGGGLYAATIQSEFSGGWTYPGWKLPSPLNYLSETDNSSVGTVVLAPVPYGLNELIPTGHQEAYWILRPQGGKWQLSPWVYPGKCLAAYTNSAGSISLDLESCRPNDNSEQLWTIGTANLPITVTAS